MGEDEKILLWVVGGFLILKLVSGGGLGNLLGSSTTANPNLLATLSAQSNISYANDATGVATSIINDFS
jgi:hypothetical protein